MCFETIRAEDIFRYRAGGRGILVDLRDREDYRAGHIPGAVSVPYRNLQEELPRLRQILEQQKKGQRPGRIILYCDRGNTSLLASRDLYKKGICTWNVYGGIRAYRGPLVQGEQP